MSSAECWKWTLAARQQHLDFIRKSYANMKYLPVKKL